MKSIRAVLFVLAALALAGAAQAAPPSGQEVLRHVRELTKGIRDYTVDVSVHVDMANVKVPDMRVRLYYKAPDKTKMVPLQGFAMVPKDALFTGDVLAKLGKNADAKVLRQETVAGRKAWVLRLTPKDDSQPGGGADLWVDQQRWLVLQVRRAGAAAGGAPLTLEISYKQQATFWVPAKMVARLQIPAEGGRHRLGHKKPQPAAGEVKKGTVTTTFANYRLNAGLSDSLFKEEQKP